METTLNSPLPALLSATAAAAMVGVCADTIDAYTARYGFPEPLWLGGRKCYRIDEVHAWLLSPERRVNTRRSGEDHPNNKWPKEFVARAIALYNGGAGLSLGQIANRLTVPKATVHKWVEGSRRAVNPDDVAAVTAALAECVESTLQLLDSPPLSQ